MERDDQRKTQAFRKVGDLKAIGGKMRMDKIRIEAPHPPMEDWRDGHAPIKAGAPPGESPFSPRQVNGFAIECQAWICSCQSHILRSKSLERTGLLGDKGLRGIQ
jgi:hypothetical protein